MLPKNAFEGIIHLHGLEVGVGVGVGVGVCVGVGEGVGVGVGVGEGGGSSQCSFPVPNLVSLLFPSLPSVRKALAYAVYRPFDNAIVVLYGFDFNVSFNEPFTKISTRSIAFSDAASTSKTSDVSG